MSSSGSNPGHSDDSRVRLDWPGGAPPRTGARASAREAMPEPDAPVDDAEPSDRLLQHLLTIREDMGADMAALRLEVAALRQSIDELSARFPMGHLGAVLAELAHLRGEVAQLAEVGVVKPKLGSLAPLVAEIAALREEISLEPVLGELAELRSELSQVRRRVALRAAGPDAREFPT